MLGLGARDVVHGVPGERERSSARHAVREVVVPVCEDRSAAIACSVQAGNHFGVGVEHLHVGVDAQAVARVEQGSAQRDAVKRGRADLR